MIPEFLFEKPLCLPANDSVFKKAFAEHKALLPSLLAAMRIPRSVTLLAVPLPREGASELWLKWRERPQDDSPWRELSLPVHFDRMTTGQTF